VRRLHPAAAVLLAGLAAGTLDISDAIVFNAFRGVTPASIFRYIASGLIGIQAAVRGGDAVVALGVAIHFTIAVFWTAVYYLLSRRFPALVRRPFLWGPVYGALLYPVMTYVVLPLTRVPHPAGITAVANRINGVLALVFCIGLAVALMLRRYAPAAGAAR
jgi:uncharacterized membrane protein YagU involved in acid resistance